MQLIIVFVLAFIFNVIWENFHARFYVHYRGRAITKKILLRAALFDAVFIFLLAIIFLYIYQSLWFVIIIGLVFAILLEKYALATNRWAYKDSMPIIPFIRTGLTPTIQLGLLTYIIFVIVGL